jgi:uncharacterized protein (TIGR02246 family)
MENTQTHVIDRLVAAYNAKDAAAFADCFSDNAEIYEHPSFPTQASKQEILPYYEKLFAEFPENRSEVLYRIVMENRVIDHERVRRTPDAVPFEVLTIYEIKDNLVRRVDFIRNSGAVWHAQ